MSETSKSMALVPASTAVVHCKSEDADMQVGRCKHECRQIVQVPNGQVVRHRRHGTPQAQHQELCTRATVKYEGSQVVSAAAAECDCACCSGTCNCRNDRPKKVTMADVNPLKRKPTLDESAGVVSRFCCCCAKFPWKTVGIGALIIGASAASGFAAAKLAQDPTSCVSQADFATQVSALQLSQSPIGSIVPFAGTTAYIPSGYLVCNGTLLSKTEYSKLFSAIGTKYNTGGEPTNKFRLPNYNDRFLQGATTAGETIAPGLPDIMGTIGYDNNAGVSGAFRRKGKGNGAGRFSDNNQVADFKASYSSSIYGASDTVQPPAVTVVYIIKANA